MPSFPFLFESRQSNKITARVPISRIEAGIVLKTEVLVEGLMFPECPRWHDGKLWFSDMQARRVMTVNFNGNTEVIVEVPGSPAGLGWLPDGRLLVVSMRDRRLMRLDPEGLVEVCNLSKLATYHCNDMVVDTHGRAYIGNFGFDYLSSTGIFHPAEIVLVEPKGKARIAADNLVFPNGTVITPDGQTFIVAETLAQRLTAFNIEADGSLSNRRVWAEVAESTPDGICLDEEGAIWVASPLSGEVLRCCKGGKVAHRVRPHQQAFACMLGGPDRRTLFVCTAESDNPDEARAKASGMIEIVRVEVPGDGLP
jgi:sugar lactone lactonase YvrE